MTNFFKVNQIRLRLKMKLAQYSWYNSSVILLSDEGFSIVIHVKKIDNTVRKLIPQVIDGASVKVELG
jgi:hypothetical protein